MADGAATIVLIHGLAAHRWVMSPLGRRLAKRGYQVSNWGYRSLWYPIERHSRSLAQFLQRLDEDPETGEVHLVTHSLGCIIGRHALELLQPRKLGRWVMLAPPNRGTLVARRLSPWLGWLCRPLTQLADTPNSFVNRLPPPSVPIGVISAASDWIVSEESTRLSTQLDWIQLPGLHSGIVWSPDTADQIEHFLTHGKFVPPNAGGP